jgi:hypothetical protein
LSLAGLFLAGVLAAVGISACGSDDPAGPITVEADWFDDATEYRGRNGSRYTYICPPDGTPNSIWGTDLYTDDSSVCTAAVHAGKITAAAGGSVTIEIRPGAAAYAASTRNGITSMPYAEWLGSYVFP